MIEDPALTRRAFMRAAAFASGSLALAGCVPVAVTSRPTTAPTLPVTAEPTTPPPSATPVVTSPPTASPAPVTLPLRQRIARMLVVGFRGMRVEDAPWLEAAIRVGGLGGVILFDHDGRTQGPRNVESPAQVKSLVAGLRALASDRELIVSVDQEGGFVTRLSSVYGFPTLASEATVGAKGAAAVKTWADGLVATLAAAGINLNLAPVVDVDVNPDNPAVGKLGRSFSADPAIVARDAGIEITAHRARGVKTALKHFPGLGSATRNTDYGVADVSTTWRGLELDPYRDLLARDLVDVVMAAHVVNAKFDADAPASLSRATVTDLLRGELGWDGPVITDDLQAGAITDAFGFDDAVELAIEAGNDLLLFANQQTYGTRIVTRVVGHIESLVESGRITEDRIDQSVARIAACFDRVRG